MSDCNRPSCSYSRRGASPCIVKPKHVRSLNFGQSILELDTVRQCSIPNRVLVIDENVAHIPCTEKTNYVRKWLEIHENGRYDSSQSSPVLGTSATTDSQRSPILASRKRPRRKTRINRNVTRLGNIDCQKNAERSINCIQSKSHYECEEKTIQCKETQHTPPGTEKSIDETSPIFDFSSHRNFKRKKRKLYEDNVSLKHSELQDYKIMDINSESIKEPDSNCNNLRERLIDRDKLKETKVKTLVFLADVKESPEKYQECIETSSSPMQERLTFLDSSSNNSDKNNSYIETDISSDSKVEECEQITRTSSSSNNLSNFIEDTNTQESAKPLEFTIEDKNFSPPGQSLQLVVDNLNETYCSEVELVRDQSTHLSAIISEVPSLNKTQKTLKSTQTDAIISTITTPSRKSPDKNMYTHLLDSGKKRRKPKKGTMVARLQSLVRAQVSGIRIWHHRLNKESNATSARYISVLIHNSTEQFGNQFLEGVLIEDRYNLLQNGIQMEQAEKDNVRAKGSLCKNVTIMLVCDIVGKLKMISDVVINIYPPWNILDRDDLTLEVMYIKISDNHEIPDVKNTVKSRKKRILKEFNCPCIEEQRELPFCARKPSSEKPDVMQQIFNF